MDSLQHLQLAHKLLSKNTLGVSIPRLIRELGVSRPTVYRVLKRLEVLKAPVVKGKRGGFFRYQPGKSFEFPGFWMSDGEVAALLGLMQWVGGPEAKVLDEIIGPIQKRLESVVSGLGVDAEKLKSMLALLPMHARTIRPGILRACCEGLLHAQRLRIRHGEAGEELERELSPQKLVRYRDNWYLDAYCHLKEGLRTFALFRIQSALVLQNPIRRIPAAELRTYFADAYGIFSGPARNAAVIRFTGFAADCAEGETWHPREEKTRKNGALMLRIPYGDSRELLRDIFRWGDEAEVLEPVELRKEAREALMRAANRYGADV